jgi:hypothetical protein
MTIKIDDASFHAPPPGAPVQVTALEIPGLTAEQLIRIRQNERELAPLNFESAGAGRSNMPPPVILGADGQPIAAVQAQPAVDTRPPAPPAQVVDATAAIEQAGPAPTRTTGSRSRLAAVAQKLSDLVRPAADAAVAEPPVVESAPVESAPPADQPAPTSSLADAARALRDRPDAGAGTYQPAASNTDSPSRGIPTAATDPGKQITGGFGDAGEAQYYPLDGTELRELVLAQMDRLVDRLRDDLRFSIAVTYPRVTARVVIEVDAFVSDASFQVPVAPVVANKTPIEIARERGDEVVFVLKEEMREMSGDGESITPPNQVRQDLGIEIPRKRFVQAGAARLMVDRLS